MQYSNNFAAIAAILCLLLCLSHIGGIGSPIKEREQDIIGNELLLLRTEVDIDHACSYYSLKTSAGNESIDLSTLQLTGIKENSGSLKDIWIETKTVRIQTKTVKGGAFEIQNGTCEDFGATKTEDGQCAYPDGVVNDIRHIWQRSHDAILGQDKRVSIMHTQNEVVPYLNGSEIEIRVCGKFALQETSDGWGALIDHVPVYRGIKYNEYDWWDITFTRRKAIQINSTDGTALSSFPILLNITYDSDMDANFEDLRFMNNGSDDAVALDYWVEAEYTSGYADVWVEVDTINTTIYMYYGSSGLTNISNITNTFLFGDDFNRANSATVGNSWAETETSGCTASIDAGRAKFLDASAGEAYITQAFSALPSGFMRTRLYLASGAGTAHFLTRLSDGDRLGNIEMFEQGTLKTYLSTTKTNISTYGVDTWIILETKLNATAGLHSTYLNNSLVSSNNAVYQAQSEVDEVLMGTPGTSGHESYTDWIIIDQYSNFTSYTMGTEENVTVFVDIMSPQNTSYYNSDYVNLSVTSIVSGTFYYSMNGAANKSFTPNTTIISPYGANNITIWLLAGTAWHTDTEYWTSAGHVCNLTYNGTTICSGEGMKYIIPCVETSYNSYQWDTTNMTYCKNGCANGVCLGLKTLSKHDCQLNQTMCIDEYNYIGCYNNAGTYEWNTTKVNCPAGCLNGQCLTTFSDCVYGESKCVGQKIIYCDDDNGDGRYEWSSVNTTLCSYACKERITGTLKEGYCSSQSAGSFQSIQTLNANFGRTFEFIFGDTTALKLAIFTAISIMIGGILGFKTNWKIGIVGFMGVFAIGTFMGWVQWYITIIFMILSGILLIHSIKNQGGQQ